MPVSVRRSPLDNKPPPEGITTLRTPQARLLSALMPAYPDDPASVWPLITRAQLGVRAGYTAISGTVTRALNGIHDGSSSGDAHPGLLSLKLVEEIAVDIDGHNEVNYRTTAAGIVAHQAHLIKQGGRLPQIRDAATCTNDRYRKTSK